MSDSIKPCPFCGGEAELDTRMHYRDFRHSTVERAVSVYCRGCSAEITICVPDVPDITGEQVVAMWNKRDAAAFEAARQEGLDEWQAKSKGTFQTAARNDFLEAENADLLRLLKAEHDAHSQLMAKHNALRMNAHETRRQLERLEFAVTEELGDDVAFYPAIRALLPKEPT